MPSTFVSLPDPHCPQFPHWPSTWSPFSSICVEHHSWSKPSLVHWWCRTPLYLNGKMHFLPVMAPDIVKQSPETWDLCLLTIKHIFHKLLFGLFSRHRIGNGEKLSISCCLVSLLFRHDIPNMSPGLPYHHLRQQQWHPLVVDRQSRQPAFFPAFCLFPSCVFSSNCNHQRWGWGRPLNDTQADFEYQVDIGYHGVAQKNSCTF